MFRMRLLVLMTGLLAAVASVARADETGSKDPEAVIDRAWKAMGNDTKLMSTKASTWKSKGTFHGMGTPIAYNAEYALEWPTKSRVKIDGEANEQHFEMVNIFNGTKGWRQMNGMTQDMDDDALAEQKEELHASWVAHLVPLKEHKDEFKLTSLGDSKLEERPVTGVQVSSKGFRDLKLFFDKDTGLLAGMERKVKDPQAGEEMTQQTIYSDYKDVDGVKQPMKVKVMRDGKVLAEGQNSDVKLLDKLDPKLFTEPKDASDDKDKKSDK